MAAPRESFAGSPRNIARMEPKRPNATPRASVLEMSPEEFREAGQRLVERIAGFLATLPERPVSPNEPPGAIRRLLGGPLPTTGEPAARLLDEAADLLFSHSLFNGHPRFWAYITSSAAPIGALADLLAGAVNPNLGGWDLSPIATEIELETVRWIAEMIGYPSACGGLLVNGGETSRLVALLPARPGEGPWGAREGRVRRGAPPPPPPPPPPHPRPKEGAPL